MTEKKTNITKKQLITEIKKYVKWFAIPKNLNSMTKEQLIDTYEQARELLLLKNNAPDLDGVHNG